VGILFRGRPSCWVPTPLQPYSRGRELHFVLCIGEGTDTNAFCPVNQGWSPRSRAEGRALTFPFVKSKDIDGGHCLMQICMLSSQKSLTSSWSEKFRLVSHPPKAPWHFSEVVTPGKCLVARSYNP